eukprot:scaffold7825_cov162-Amphora_coffeaeformis.AAC.2
MVNGSQYLVVPSIMMMLCVREKRGDGKDQGFLPRAKTKPGTDRPIDYGKLPCSSIAHYFVTNQSAESVSLD